MNSIIISDNCFYFENGYAVVDLDDKQGVIDLDGNLIIPFEYDEIQDYSEGLFCVRVADKVGFLNTANEWVIEPQYDYADSFSEGLAPVEINDRYGYIDSKGHIVIPLDYSVAYSFSEGLASVEDFEGNKGFINNQGEWMFSHFYAVAPGFLSGLSSVRNEKQLAGIINKSGKEIVPCLFKEITYYGDRYMEAIQTDDSLPPLYYDRDGQQIENLFNNFDHFDSLNPYLQPVVKDGLYGIANMEGQLIVPCSYSEKIIIDTGDSLFITSKNGLYGAVSLENRREIIPYKYYKIESLGQDRYIVYSSDQEAVVVDNDNRPVFSVTIVEETNSINLKKKPCTDLLNTADMSYLTEQTEEQMIEIEKARMLYLTTSKQMKKFEDMFGAIDYNIGEK